MPWFLVLAGLLVTSVCAALAWRWQRNGDRDAGIIDVVWTLGLGAHGVLYAVSGSGWGPRRLVLGLVVALWSVRLGRLLLQRMRRGVEDGRYTAMRKSLGDTFQRWMFVFFQVQALLVAGFALPYAFLAQVTTPRVTPWDILGLGLWIVAFAGEVLADAQLRAWRNDPQSAGRTCRAGLWAWSRHPNYFCEWLLWIALALAATQAPQGWIVWAAPLVMLFLVLKVTGIPPTEAQALRSRGADYRDYQRSVSAFVPWFPKRRPA